MNTSQISKVMPTLSRLILGLVMISPMAVAAEDPVRKDALMKKELQWGQDLETALRTAKAENKKVLLRFSAEWCGPCKIMDRRVWPDPEVQAALGDQVLLVKYDVDDAAGQAMGRKYGIQSIPLMILLDADGTVISRKGFMSPPAFIQFLADAKTAKPSP